MFIIIMVKLQKYTEDTLSLNTIKNIFRVEFVKAVVFPLFVEILLNETYFNDLTLPIKHHGYGNHRRIRPAELGKLTLYAAEIELKHDWHHGLIHRSDAAMISISWMSTSNNIASSFNVWY